jgi:hypothetical protein
MGLGAEQRREAEVERAEAADLEETTAGESGPWGLHDELLHQGSIKGLSEPEA